MACNFNNQIGEVVMATYSHSRLSTFEQCPRKYKFKYVEHFPIGDRKSIEGYLGGVVHEALRRLYELAMAGKIWTEDRLLNYYEETWARLRPGEIYIRDEELKEEDFRKKGRDMLSYYFHAYHPFNQEKTVGLERNISINLDPEGEYRAQGIIDRLAVTDDGTLQIHDYKTARSIVPQQYLDEDRQLALYQLGVQQMWPDRKNFELVWHYLAVEERRTSKRTDLDINELVDSTISLIREIKQAIQDDNFPAKESRLCNWCEYMSFCPAKIHPLSLENMSEGELKGNDVVSAVDRFVEIKRHIAGLKNEEEEIRQRLIRYAKDKEVSVLAGSDKNVNIRTGSAYKPQYADLTEGKESERKKFIDFLIRTDMIDQVFSYHYLSFDNFIKKAKYDPRFKEELFSFIKSFERKPELRVTNKES